MPHSRSCGYGPDERMRLFESSERSLNDRYVGVNDKRGNGGSFLGRYPDFHWSNELAGSRFADMDSVGRNLFARFEMERHPRLGHALELHLLDGQARRRIHDGCYDAHGLRRYGHRACWSMPSLQIAPIFWMLSDPRAALGKPNRVVRRRRLSSSVRAYAA